MPDRVYFDTNIWISALDSEDEKNPAAKALFEQVRRGKQTLVISNWVFLEIIKVIIGQALKDPSIRDVKTADAIKTYVTTIFSNYGSLVLGMKNVVFSDPATPTRTILRKAYDLSQRTFGHVTKEPDFYKYHGPYQVDLLHALLARDLQCKKMLTFDDHFSLLKQDPMIQPLAIEVLPK